MNIAEEVKSRSTCLSQQVGAIAVKDNQIISTGYNGAPKNMKHCSETGCRRENVESGTRHELCRGVHAEANIIIQAAMHNAPIKGATVYTTHKPCILCTKLLINAEISRVVYKEKYEDEMASEMQSNSDVKFERLEEESKNLKKYYVKFSYKIRYSPLRYTSEIIKAKSKERAKKKLESQYPELDILTIKEVEEDD